VAGVVNFIVDKSFVGAELSASYGETKYQDGAESRVSARVGETFDQGKGRVVVMADFLDRTPIFLRDRSGSAPANNSYRAPPPWNLTTVTTFNALSSTSAYGEYELGSVNASGGFTAARPSTVSSSFAATSGIFYLVPTATGTGFSATTPARTGVQAGYYWNNNAYRVIHPESERGNVLASLEFDLTPKITAFTELMASQARSVTQREPDSTSNSVDGNIVVPANNPYNPFGTSFWDPNGTPNPTTGAPRLVGTPSAVLIEIKRFEDFPPRIATVTDSFYRELAGVRGKVFDTWSWEAAALWSNARVIDYEANSTRKSLLINAIDQTNPSTAFNPFNQNFAVQNGQLVVTGPATNSAAVEQTFRAPYIRNGITKLGSGDFHATGDVLNLWGGNKISAAFGAEFRYEAYDNYLPPYSGLNPAGSGLPANADDFLSDPATSDTHGDRHVTSEYAETVVPVVGHQFTLPLVKSLEFTASVRQEHYSDFGDTTRPKFGVNWQPVEWLKFRASYNQGFVAPNLAELFTGQLELGVTATDTYRFPVTGLPTDGSANRLEISSGNLALKPEKSRGKTAGVVVDVPHVRGLSASIDYWEIRVDNVITASGGVTADTLALEAATQRELAAGVPINSINLGSGTSNYLGDPSVVRNAVTSADQAAFAAYNATAAPGNQEAAVGSINYIRSTYFNAAEQFVNGFDYNLKYEFPPTAIGTFAFEVDCTQLLHAYLYNTVGGPQTQLLATNSSNIGGADPRWRSMATLAWHRRAWTAGLIFHYIGRYADVNATTTAATYASLNDPAYLTPVLINGTYSYAYTVHDSKSYDAFVRYDLSGMSRWLRNTVIRVGVDDLFNVKPPLSSNSFGYDAAVYNQLAYGLTWSVELTKRL